MHKAEIHKPTVAVKLSLRHCMEKAASDATTHFDKLLTNGVKVGTPVARQMRQVLRQSFDWRTEDFSVKDTIHEIEEDAVIYRGIAEGSDTVDQFFDAVQAVADAHVDLLTFSRNNYPEAQLRRDQFCHFVDAAAKLLREQGYLAEDDDRFDRLINGYDMSINGYVILRERVSENTDEQFASLLEFAAAAVAAETQQGVDPDDEETAKRMGLMYQEIANEYGLGTRSGALLPPAYLYLADMAQTIAVKQARNVMPHAHSREELEPVVAEHRNALMQAMTSVPHDPSQLEQLGLPEKVLLEAQAKAFGQPIDFRSRLVKAAEEAGTTMMSALPRLHKEAQPFLGMIGKASGHQNMALEGVGTNTSGQLEHFCSQHSIGMLQELADANTMNDVIVSLDQDSEQVLKDCIIGMHHPAEILAHRTYAEALGKAMVQHYREAGLPTQEVRAEFDAMTEKYEHAYAANVEAARWCLVLSENAYANFGAMALAMTKAQRGKPYGELSTDDVDGVPRVAAQYFIGACKDRHLPDAWTSCMFMPLLYRRALDHVTKDIEREGQMNRPHYFADTAAEQKEEAFVVAKDQLHQAVRIQASERIVPLLERTVGMFSPDAPSMNGWPSERPEDVKEAAPYIDSRTLHGAMAFFEQGAHKGIAN